MSSPQFQVKNPSSNEQNIDFALRPGSWAEYVGQDKVKRHLRVIIDAAKQRKENCDHLLFYGQAGLGKTTLAYLVAKELNTNIKVTSGPALEKLSDVVAILSNIEPNEVIFIDEIHRINKLIEEALYPAMESRRLHLIIGKGPSARTLSLDLPPFTLVGATTKVNLLSGPLRSRFGGIFRLDYYEVKDIESIIKRSAELLGVKINSGAIKMLALASRFTPRVANRLLKRCRDFAQVENQTLINESIAKKTLEFLEIDEMGLESYDRQLLEVIIEKFHGGPVGVKAIAAALNEDPRTVEDIYEPFLMSVGFISRTSSGRVILPAAYRHLNIKKDGQLI